VIVSTDNGDVLLIDSFELKGVIHHGDDAQQQQPSQQSTPIPLNQSLTLPPPPPPQPTSINSIVGFAKGFICGGTNGIMRIFERFEDSKELYKCTKIFRLHSRPATMVSLAVSPSEETLLCCTNDRQIYTFTLSNMDILKEDSVSFDHLSAGFHSPDEEGKTSRITGIDVCVWKPVAITAGADKSVRVWNYRDRTLELTKYFSRDAQSVALHPSGLYCLLGFMDALKLASIFVNDIRPFLEINIKNCQECRFSHGGQFFAAVNGSVVQVFATYSGEMLTTLKGHSGKIRSLAWKAGDRKIVTASMDGNVFVWNVMKGVKEGEYSIPHIAWQCCACSNDMSGGMVVGSDSILRHLDMSNMTVKGEIPLDSSVSSMALTSNNKMIILGTCDENQPGKLRTKMLGGLNTYTEPFVETYCHDGGVTKMRLTFDGQALLTGGQDGALCMFDMVVEEPEDRKSMTGAPIKGKEHKEVSDTFGEEILVTKADLEEQSSVMAKLKNKVEELSLNNEYQLRLKDLNFKDKVKVSRDEGMDR